MLRAKTGDSLRLGLLNGPLGEGRVEKISATELLLSCTWQSQPPAPAKDVLLLAMPRPKVLARCLAQATALGFAHLVLCRTWRTDKSHLATRVLEPDHMRQHLVAGLEQSGRTYLPKVEVFPLFKPMVEDQLDALLPQGQRYLAHPRADLPLHQCRLAADTPFTLALGPEGGFIPYEIEALQQQGFTAVHCGPHPLRVETALASMAGQLQLLRAQANTQG